MKPRISLITLGVDDLDASLRFYRDGLGLTTQGIVGTEFEYGAVVFFDLQAGLKLALWPRKSLAKDAGLPTNGRSTLELSIGHNVSSKAEVDRVMDQARGAGAVLVKPAQDTFWGGYAGYFQDPDGHLWEIAWNPQWPVFDDPGETRPPTSQPRLPHERDESAVNQGSADRPSAERFRQAFRDIERGVVDTDRRSAYENQQIAGRLDQRNVERRKQPR